MALLFAFPEYDFLVPHLLEGTSLIKGDVVVTHFPDGESYVRLESPVENEEIYIVCGLDQPDKKAMALLFFAQTAKEFGAKKIKLLSPYLGYMRQDKRFQEGEALTSALFAQFLSQHIDFLATIDPHLHRHKSLSEIYTIPTQVLHATDLVASWIRENIPNPLLVGPDEESEQWVADIAKKASAPYLILHKDRYGDKDVKVSVPDVNIYKNCTPVLVDDIISTARTMIETVKHLKEAGMASPVCIGIHAVFSEDSYELLQKSGIQRIVTCNTIPHPTNTIDISTLLKSIIT